MQLLDSDFPKLPGLVGMEKRCEWVAACTMLGARQGEMRMKGAFLSSKSQGHKLGLEPLLEGEQRALRIVESHPQDTGAGGARKASQSAGQDGKRRLSHNSAAHGLYHARQRLWRCIS
jgi:hypothetical protein